MDLDYYTLNIIDKTGQLIYDGKTGSRGGYAIKELVLHETAGPSDSKNATGALATQLDNNTLSWFLKTDNELSIHYFIGGENTGAPVYRCCPENIMAYHAIGNKGVAAGGSVENHISIGIERMGQPNDGPVGPKQTAALCKLALDICRRNKLTSDQIVSHASIQSDKRDGNTLLAVVKKFVSDNLGVIHVESNQPSKPAALPYDVTIDPAGALIFPGNIPLNFGFKEAFLTLFGNVDQGELSSAIMRGVKIFGLPVAPEVADDTGSSQDFELATFRFNKNEAEGWKVRLYRDRKAA